MADIKLGYDRANDRYDLALDGAGQPTVETGLRSAVIAAVLSWGRAREGDQLPGFSSDRKGHWADPWAAGGRKGSRLWLMYGRIVTPRAIADAKAYLAEPLAPFKAKGLVRDVVVETWRSGVTRISGRAVLVHLDGAEESIEFDPLIG